MEKLRPRETTYKTFVVKCETHGVLGYVYSATAGMLLFDGHRQLSEDKCSGVSIEPKDVPLDPDIYREKYIPTDYRTKPKQKFIPP